MTTLIAPPPIKSAKGAMYVRVFEKNWSVYLTGAISPSRPITDAAKDMVIESSRKYNFSIYLKLAKYKLTQLIMIIKLIIDNIA